MASFRPQGDSGCILFIDNRRHRMNLSCRATSLLLALKNGHSGFWHTGDSWPPMLPCPFALTPESLMLCCATDTPVILGIESSPTFEADAPCVCEGANVLTEKVPNCSPQRSIGACGLEPNILSATYWLHHPDLAALLSMQIQFVMHDLMRGLQKK